MGWLIYDRSVSDPQAECDRICTWNNESSAGRVVASCLVGNTYYAAIERTDKPDGKVQTFAAVFLIQRSPFGYKDMDETMGPCEAKPTRSVLEKLSPLPPPPIVTERVECWACNGAGKYSFAKGVNVSTAERVCHNCEGAGDEPIPEQRDRYRYAREWRRKAWSRFGGEPQGRQVELAL